MENDRAVKKLIDILTAFYTEGRPFEEDPTFSITREFLENLKGVLFTKQLVSQRRWEYFFQTCYFREHPTPATYLRNVIYACRQCARIHLNIFERFLSMFAIILHLRMVTFEKAEVDLSKLISDIFMAIYETELKKPFERCGGFCRFVEYINTPKYLASNLIGKYATSESKQKDPKDTVMEDLEKQVDILFSQEKELSKDFRLEDSQVDRPSINLAQKILKSAKINRSPCIANLVTKPRDLPKKLKKQLDDEKARRIGLNLASSQNDIFNSKLSALSQQMIEQNADEKKVLQVMNKQLEIPSYPSHVAMKSESSAVLQQIMKQLAKEKKISDVNSSASLNSNTEANFILGQMEDNERQENILQAVIKYNRSINSGTANLNNGLLMEAREILENLRDKIETLIGLLDE